MHAKNSAQMPAVEDNHEWFNLWHAHDWNYDEGSDSYDDLKLHLDELSEMYRCVLLLSQSLDFDTQCWILLLPDDPIQDSIYLHSGNPHTDFPAALEDVDWNCNLPSQYRELAAGRRSGKRVYSGEISYYIMEP